MKITSGPFFDLGLASTTLHPLNIKVEGADGIWINIEGGRRLFDAISGIGVSNFGHSHPMIREAIHAQTDRHLHTMVYGEFIHDSTSEAASLLTSFLPTNLDSVYFVNSGAEAVEGALKLAKRSTGRSRILSCLGGYHGNTSGALSVSSNSSRKAPFLPLLPEVSFITFNDIPSLEAIDLTVACIIVETVQGDAGVRIPTKEWMTALRETCTKFGTLLILDEVQCGMGRCGTPFAFTQFDITPDILCAGKALGGGLPIGAFVASRQLMATLAHSPELGHITTFGGNPLTNASSAATLKLLAEINWDEIELRGEVWASRLRAHPAVKDVRRIGYFFAVELKSPEAVTAAIKKGIELGVLLFWFLSLPHAFRLSPPLTMTDEELEIGWELIAQALD